MSCELVGDKGHLKNEFYNLTLISSWRFPNFRRICISRAYSFRNIMTWTTEHNCRWKCHKMVRNVAITTIINWVTFFINNLFFKLAVYFDSHRIFFWRATTIRTKSYKFIAVRFINTICIGVNYTNRYYSYCVLHVFQKKIRSESN